jgi:hypothetical protein
LSIKSFFSHEIILPGKCFPPQNIMMDFSGTQGKAVEIAKLLAYAFGILIFFYLVNSLTILIQSTCRDDVCTKNTRSAVLWMSLIAVVSSIAILLIVALKAKFLITDVVSLFKK